MQTEILFYFENKSLYKPTIKVDALNESMVDDYEREKADLIRAYKR